MKKNFAVGESCAFITSDKKITFYGCDGVEKYTECEIELSMVDVRVRIVGHELGISSYVSGEIEVTGSIESVNFDRGVCKKA